MLDYYYPNNQIKLIFVESQCCGLTSFYFFQIQFAWDSTLKYTTKQGTIMFLKQFIKIINFHQESSRNCTRNFQSTFTTGCQTVLDWKSDSVWLILFLYKYNLEFTTIVVCYETQLHRMNSNQLARFASKDFKARVSNRLKKCRDVIGCSRNDYFSHSLCTPNKRCETFKNIRDWRQFNRKM